MTSRTNCKQRKRHANDARGFSTTKIWYLCCTETTKLHAGAHIWVQELPQCLSTWTQSHQALTRYVIQVNKSLIYKSLKATHTHIIHVQKKGGKKRNQLYLHVMFSCDILRWICAMVDLTVAWCDNITLGKQKCVGVIKAGPGFTG